MTVRQLREALEGVPDDSDVRVVFHGLSGLSWNRIADRAYEGPAHTNFLVIVDEPRSA